MAYVSRFIFVTVSFSSYFHVRCRWVKLRWLVH